jgi:hypothetical protein
MKILTFLIASTILVNSCDKKEAQSTETSEVTTPIVDSTKVADTITANTATEMKAGAVIQDPTVAVAKNSPTGKPALNPAHGEPFHRCDIQVGAPIDSAPQQNAAPVAAPQMQSNNTSFNTNPISPSMSAPASTAVSAPQPTGPKPALNPAHGEPWHKCELQVGAPLT